MKQVICYIIFLSYAAKQIECENSVSLYQKRKYKMDEWPQTIYKEISHQVGSKIECTALCRAESVLCYGLIWDGSICYLTDPRSHFSVIPSPQTKDQDLFIDLGMISTTLGTFLKLTDPIVNYWMARIYTSIPLDSLLFCALECEVDLDCKLFTIEDGLCHLGNGITYNHSVLPIENHSEEIYVDTGIINELGPMYLLNNSNASWVKYIYYENQCDSRDRCELWCYLESTPCQFIVYTELVCHLGTTGKENDSLVSLHTTTQQDIWLNKKGIEHTNYEDMFDKNIPSSKYAPFMFRSLSAEDFNQSCEFFCAVETDPVCHFYYLNDETCFLGNMKNTLPGITSSATLEDIQAFLPTSHSIPLDFYTIPIQNHIWKRKMHSQLDLNTTIGSCALRCLLMDLPMGCDFFAYDGTSCYLGSTSYYQPIEASDDMFNISIRESLSSTLDDLFTPRTTATWSFQMYKKINVSYPSSKSKNECLLRCYFDDGPCYSFVVHDDSCYLGDPFVNSTLFINTEEAIIMERNPKLHLTHGGRGDIGDENTAIIFRGYSGTCDHSLLHLPFPLRQMGYAYGDDSIFVCGGTSDIVGEQDKCYRWKFDTFPRAWVPLPPMMNTQVMFPMFYHNGTLYAAGGRNEGINTINNMRFLTLGSSSWENGGFNEPVGFYAHCGILYQDRIYTFGGSRTSLLYSKSIQIYDIETQSWSSGAFPLLEGTRHLACSLVTGNGASNPDIFLLAGGETGSGQYSNKVYSIDPNLNEINEIHQLSMSVSLFGSGDNFAVFDQNLVFLAVGYGNGTHRHDIVFKWNPWIPSFNQYSSKISGREQPGNAMIPLRHLPVCQDQSQLWKRLVNHEKTQRFHVGGWNQNTQYSFHSAHSHFSTLNQYSCDGTYHFRLIYPELGTFNEWYQTNDPSNQSQTSVTGFLGLALGMPYGFNGLVYNNVDALMVGDSNTINPQWFSVGRIKEDSLDGTFPGPPNTFVSKVKLFIRNDCATTT